MWWEQACRPEQMTVKLPGQPCCTVWPGRACRWTRSTSGAPGVTIRTGDGRDCLDTHRSASADLVMLDAYEQGSCVGGLVTVEATLPGGPNPAARRHPGGQRPRGARAHRIRKGAVDNFYRSGIRPSTERYAESRIWTWWHFDHIDPSLPPRINAVFGAIRERCPIVHSDRHEPPIDFDPPEHTRYRRFIQRNFTRQAVAGFEGLLRELVELRITELVGKGHAHLVTELARHVPLAAIAVVLGLPSEDGELFVSFTTRIFVAVVAGDHEASRSANQECRSYLAGQVERLRDAGQACLINEITGGRVDGKPLPLPEQLAMLQMLVMAGHETTVNGIGTMLYRLVSLPGVENWDPHTIHTHYFGFSIPSAEIGAFLYIRYQPAFPLCQGGVSIFRGPTTSERGRRPASTTSPRSAASSASRPNNGRLATTALTARSSHSPPRRSSGRGCWRGRGRSPRWRGCRGRRSRGFRSRR